MNRRFRTTFEGPFWDRDEIDSKQNQINEKDFGQHTESLTPAEFALKYPNIKFDGENTKEGA